MSSEFKSFEGEKDDIDEFKSQDASASAWHVSRPKDGISRTSAYRISDPNSFEGLVQEDSAGWYKFSSDETLPNTPIASRRQSVIALDKSGKYEISPLPFQSAPTPAPVSSTSTSTSVPAAPPSPPQAVGFWNHGLSKTRREIFFAYFKTLLILCIFVFVVLSIYWGVLAQVYGNLANVTVAVVDFDGQSPYQETEALVGPAVVAATQAQLLLPRHVGYTVRPASDFGNDPMNVRVAVHDEKFWAAIVINKNATALLRQAVEIGNSSYDPFGAAQIIYNQARDIEAYNQYVSPALLALASDVTVNFGRLWTSNVLTNQSLDSSTYARAPQALSPAIDFSIYNLRPFDPPTAIPTVSIGLIYLIIIAFFSFGFFIPTHMKFVVPNAASPHPPLKFYQLVVWRYCATIFAYFAMSLFYSLVSLAFQIPFSHSPTSTTGPAPRHWPKTEVVDNADYLGHATFVVYWMLNFMGMSALGLACENMAMLLGTPWTALWLIFWVITNVATGFYSLELASDFYRWGYAWPLRQIVVGSRTLLFGTKDTLGLNFGILLAWAGVGTLLFPVCCWVFRWKNIREKKKLAAMQSGNK